MKETGHWDLSDLKWLLVTLYAREREKRDHVERGPVRPLAGAAARVSPGKARKDLLGQAEKWETSQAAV